MPDQDALLKISHSLGELESHSKTISKSMSDVCDNLKALSDDFNQHKIESEGIRVIVKASVKKLTALEEFKEDWKAKKNMLIGMGLIVTFLYQITFGSLASFIASLGKMSGTH